LKYAVIDLPLESIHTAAFRGAAMVRCAGEQGKYWEMRMRLFGNPQALSNPTATHAAAVGVDARRLDACLESDQVAAAVRRDMALAQGIGIEGTPTFVLGVTDAATGKLKPVRLLTGARPFSSFQGMIDLALADLEGAAR
jgi:protein-disulfide isomerase